MLFVHWAGIQIPIFTRVGTVVIETSMIAYLEVSSPRALQPVNDPKSNKSLAEFMVSWKKGYLSRFVVKFYIATIQSTASKSSMNV